METVPYDFEAVYGAAPAASGVAASPAPTVYFSPPPLVPIDRDLEEKEPGPEEAKPLCRASCLEDAERSSEAPTSPSPIPESLNPVKEEDVDQGPGQEQVLETPGKKPILEEAPLEILARKSSEKPIPEEAPLQTPARKSSSLSRPLTLLSSITVASTAPEK